MPIDKSKIVWDKPDTSKVVWDKDRALSIFTKEEIEEASKAGIHSELMGIPLSVALENIQEIYDRTDSVDVGMDFSQVTEGDFNRPISTTTGKPIPTTRELFAGGKAVMNLIPYGFASFTRGLVPKAAEDSIMQPLTKLLTGDDYVSPITEAMKASGKYLSEDVQAMIGTPARMTGIILPLSISFNTASSIIKTLGVSEKFLIKDSPILSKMAYHIFRGGIAGTIYEGLESGEPEEIVESAVFFAALDGAFGTAAGTIKKVSEATWYRKLAVKERDLVVQTANDLHKAGQSEGKIIRGLSDKTKREQLFEEGVAKRAVPEKAIRAKTGEIVIVGKPVPEVIKPIVKPSEVITKKYIVSEGESFASGEVINKDTLLMLSGFVPKPLRRQGIYTRILKQLVTKAKKEHPSIKYVEGNIISEEAIKARKRYPSTVELLPKEEPPLFRTNIEDIIKLTKPKVVKATSKQIKASHVIAREKGWLSSKGKVKPQYRRLAKAFTGKTSIAKMTKAEASEFISALKKVPAPEFVSGRLKPASISLSKDITPKDFFKREFKEPSLIKIITPSNRYAYSLGVSDLIEPSIKARTAMLNERKNQFDILDKTRTLINEVGKTPPAELRQSRLKNKPTKAEVRMWEALDKFKTAKAAGLTGQEADIFTELRSLTDVMLVRTNEVRAQVGLEPIKSMKAYVTHISDVFSKKGLDEKYPFPEEIRYWLDFINPKHIYNPTALKRMVEARPGLLKDPIKALKAMVSMDLKQIYLEQPNMLFREQMKAFKGIMPASTRQWVQAYMNEVVKGMPTKLDNLANASLDKLGITKMIDAVLEPFGRTLSYNPIKDITGQISRVVHDATIWGKIRLVVRNHTQKFLVLGLYDTKAFAKAMFPAPPKLLKLIKENEFWKISSQQFMERMPEGMLGKLEKIGFKPYGHSHISNVTFTQKASYYACKELKWSDADTAKEMEFAAMTAQYWYNLMGMPEIYRSGLTRVFAVLQSWWMNYATNYWREMLTRAIYGKTGWGKPIPVKWRLGALRHIITSIAFVEGTRRAFGLDYSRIALFGTLPAYLSPPGQIVLGLYNYVSATDERGRKKAINQIKWSWSAFVPGSGAWRDFIKAWKGKMTAKELFFYKERKK